MIPSIFNVHMQALSECNGTIQQLKVKHVPTDLSYTGKLFWGSGHPNKKLMMELSVAGCLCPSTSCQPRRSPSLRNGRMRLCYCDVQTDVMMPLLFSGQLIFFIASCLDMISIPLCPYS